MYATPTKLVPTDLRANIVLDTHISYGQSWRSNAWPSFGGFSFNTQPQTLLALKTSFSTGGGPPAPLPTSAGISIPGTIIGLTHYQASDAISIGRCAGLAHQLWRMYHGGTTLGPILEFCAAYPGSTWATGGGGGLSPGATFTASVSAGSMVVTAVSSRQLALGQLLVGPGIPANCYVLTGANPGTTGTYRVAVSTVVVGGTTFTTSGGAAFVGGIGGASANDTLTVSSVTTGTVTVGDTITAGMPTGTPTTTILANISGSGGAGTYQVRIGPAINVTSQTLQTQGTSWNNQATIIAAIESVLPAPMLAEAA